MNRMIRTILVLALLFSFSPSYAGNIYRWVDQSGTNHFTDDYERVPSDYRSQVRLRVVEDAPQAEPLATPAAPRKEETKRDIYGLDEEWWRDRVRPWRSQLKEALEDYEHKDKAFLEESKMLVVRKFGSHQQFKFAVLGMDRVRQERVMHESRLNEAREVLKRISRNAEESGADRDWLNGASMPRQMALMNTGEVRTDIYGRDRTWWREKALAQREQMNEAVGNYEKAYEKYSKVAEELGPWRFGRLSLTQYQMLSCRLDDLNSEMASHQARVAEAGQRLKDLLKEAVESNASLRWLEE